MIQTDDSKTESTPKHPSLTTALRVARYLSARVLTIAITIFIGVFITISIANYHGAEESSYRDEILIKLGSQYPILAESQVNSAVTIPPDQLKVIDSSINKLQIAYGLQLPFFPRTFLLTCKALRLDLGVLLSGYQTITGLQYVTVRDILLTDLPHSLLLIVTAFLLLFALGIPLALALIRKPGGLLDRLTTLLVPISSIPSWVLTILLILIFSIEIHLLPPSGMYDSTLGETKIQSILAVAKHMILPVLAILLSMFFQCVYAWRTFFLLYTDEHYLELAKAKGLPQRIINQRYVLRPTLPYIITSFSMLLVGFWQMTAALEYILNWPGIGREYIYSLPHLLDEGQKYLGNMNITVGIVVLYAFLLGITVLILDIVYAFVDPRVRIGNEDQTVRPVVARKYRLFRRIPRRSTFPGMLSDHQGHHEKPVLPPKKERIAFSDRIRSFWASLKPIGSVLNEIFHYPTAVIGIVIILLLVGGSILAVTLFPFNRLGELWNTLPAAGFNIIPKYAQPIWVNWFRLDKFPETIILDSSNDSAKKNIRIDSSGMPRITITFPINNISSEFPQDVTLYFDAKYDKKQPFAALTWITPDGRTYNLGGTSIDHSGIYSLSANNSIQGLLQKDKQWQTWFLPAGSNYPTPAFDLLFAIPHVNKPIALKGPYQLQLVGYTFEQASDINVKLVVLGQVYGWGGTDFLGRNLLIPLLWGMPFALLIGLVGASVTTLISITLAAVGVWYGGWVDTLIQRLVEANMILPVIAICVLVYAYFNVSIWVILWIVVLLNVFGSPIKTFRAALLQVKNAPYIESARAYNTSNGRIIFHYLIPRILPVLLPQFVSLIPSYVFLEATLGIFGVTSDYPTWGSVIYSAIRNWGNWGNAFWVLEPIGLLLLTGFAFTMLGFALERILNPRLKDT